MYTIIDLCWGGHGVLLYSKRHIDRREAIKTIDVADEFSEITWRFDVTSRKQCNITLCRVLCNVTSGKPCDM